MVAQICALNAIKILRPQKHNLCVNIEQHQRLAGALGYVTLQDRLSHLQVGFGHGATHEIGTLGGNFGITRVAHARARDDARAALPEGRLPRSDRPHPAAGGARASHARSDAGSGEAAARGLINFCLGTTDTTAAVL